MDQAAQDRIKREIEDHVRTLLPDGAVRRVEWPSHHDDPHIEPGELLPSLILTEPPGRRRGRPEPGQAIKKFQAIHGPGLKQFRYELPRRGLRSRTSGSGSKTPAATAGAASSWPWTTRAEPPTATSPT